MVHPGLVTVVAAMQQYGKDHRGPGLHRARCFMRTVHAVGDSSHDHPIANVQEKSGMGIRTINWSLIERALTERLSTSG